MPAKKRSKYNHKRSKTKRRQGFFALLRHRLPGWTWVLGGVAMMGLYIWGFWYFFVSPYGIRWKAIYGEIDYPAGYNIHGIDVSHYQGYISWAEVARDPQVTFVIMKATEASDFVDDRYQFNIR